MVERSIKNTIHRRHNTPRMLGHEGNALVTVGYTEVPKHIIEDFVPNQEAKQFLAREFWYLLNPEFLLQHVYWAVPPKVARYQKLMTNESGRTLEGVLGGEFVPFADRFVGSNIDQKGGFRSGALYMREEPEEPYSPRSTPYGLLDGNHIQKFTYNSNRLLNTGYRSSLSLGGVTLKKRALFEWMVTQGYPPQIIERADHDMSQMRNNPATFWRLGGVARRWKESVAGVPDEEVISIESTDLDKMHKAHSYTRAARLFVEECVRFPEVAKKYVQSKSDYDKTVETLRTIALRKKISVYQFELYQKYFAGMLMENVRSLALLCKEFNLEGLSTLMNLSDIDLSLFVYDLEATEISYDQNNLEPFNRERAGTYLYRLLKYIDPSIIDDFSSFFGLTNHSNQTIAQIVEKEVQHYYHPNVIQFLLRKTRG